MISLLGEGVEKDGPKMKRAVDVEREEVYYRPLRTLTAVTQNSPMPFHRGKVGLASEDKQNGRVLEDEGEGFRNV